MARRDMIKTAAIAAGRVPDYYDITATEIHEIYEMVPDDPYLAIITAFRYGFVLGSRAHAAGKYSEKKKNYPAAPAKRLQTD